MCPGNVVACESGIWCGDGAVEEEFDRFDGSRFGARVARVADAIATDGDACAVGISFLWAYFTHDSCVRDVVPAVQRDVMVADRFEGIGAVDSFFGGIGRVGSNALAEAAEFVCVGFIPGFFVGRVSSQLSMLQHSSCFGVQDWRCHWGVVVASVVLIVSLFGKEGVIVACTP